MREKDCSKCRKGCSISFPEEERQKIHESFWALGDSDRRRIFVSNLVEEEPVNRRRHKDQLDSRRSNTRIYYLRSGRNRVPVCKGFFLATLDISEGVIHNILKHRDETSWFPRESLQGRAPKTNVRPEEVKDVIREHIRSFIDPDMITGKRGGGVPVQEIVGNMTVKKMYLAYVSECLLNDITPEKQWLYRKICNTEFNLKFISDVIQEGGDHDRDDVIHEFDEEEEVGVEVEEEGDDQAVYVIEQPEQEVEHEEVTTTAHDGDHIYYHEDYFLVKKDVGDDTEIEEEVEHEEC